MLNPNQRYRFVLDKKTLRPACVILQAMYGGDKMPCYLFDEWETAPTPNFAWVIGTGREIKQFAERTRCPKTQDTKTSSAN